MMMVMKEGHLLGERRGLYIVRKHTIELYLDFNQPCILSNVEARGSSVVSQPEFCPWEPPPNIYSGNILVAVDEFGLEGIEYQEMVHEISNGCGLS